MDSNFFIQITADLESKRQLLELKEETIANSSKRAVMQSPKIWPRRSQVSF